MSSLILLNGLIFNEIWSLMPMTGAGRTSVATVADNLSSVIFCTFRFWPFFVLNTVYKKRWLWAKYKFFGGEILDCSSLNRVIRVSQLWLGSELVFWLKQYVPGSLFLVGMEVYEPTCCSRWVCPSLWLERIQSEGKKWTPEWGHFVFTHKEIGLGVLVHNSNLSKWKDILKK